MWAIQWTLLFALASMGKYTIDGSRLAATTEVNANNGTSMQWISSVNVDSQLPSTSESETNYALSGHLDENGERTTSQGNNTADSDDKIVGGKNTYISKYPYQLQMNLYGTQVCGASIISANWVVTAAHCLYNDRGKAVPLNRITFRAGSTYRGSGGRLHTVEQSFVPQRYTPKVSHDYDFAVLKVKNPFQFNYLIQPIRLPRLGEEVPVGSNAVLTGWGDTSHRGEGSRILQEVTIPIVSQARCQQSYNTVGITISKRMVCAGSRAKDSCQGDSGGPMALNGTLVGVVSFGTGCGDALFPGVNSKVSVYRNFIKEITGV